MRPYWALLQDSLREATHSRVLWMVLGLIVLVLLAIVPLGVSYPPSSTITRSDLRDTASFAKELVTASKSDQPAARKIWESFDESLQDELTQYVDTLLPGHDQPVRAQEMSVNRQLRRALNEIIEQPDFFSSDALTQVALDAEAKSLVPMIRNDQQQERLNRLVIEASFPDQLERRSGLSAQITYLIWPVGNQIPITRNQVEQFVDLALTGFTNFFLGFIGIFAGVLVTASIVPSTFETGSVNLLLSKPISRWLLYLTKIVGGCWFVLFNGAVLVIGVWLISGWRLGMWNHRLLLTIPLFLFGFLIYYSVSALAGLIWRNTVVAIVVTVVFWLLCFVLGLSHGMIRNLAMAPQKIIAVIRAGDQTVALTEAGRMQRWDTSTANWQQILKSETKNQTPEFAHENQLLGPLYDPVQDRVLLIERGWSSELIQTSAANDWNRTKVGSAPRDCREFIATGNNHFYAFSRDGLSMLATAETRTTPLSMLKNAIPAFAGKLLPKGSEFRQLGPTRDRRPSHDAVAHVIADEDRIQCGIVDKGVVHLYDLDEQQQLSPIQEVEIGNEEDRFVIGGGGAFWLCADQSGLVRIYDRSQMKELYRDRPCGRIEPRFASASTDGTWLAVTFHDGSAWLYDTQSKHEATRRLPHQGDISCIAFSLEDTMLVADRTNRVQEIRLNDGETVATFQPPDSLLFRVYRYLLNPIYRIFPRPGELANTNQYLLTNSKSLNFTMDLRESRPIFDPWAPVWNSAIFAALVILAGCIYISRVEF